MELLEDGLIAFFSAVGLTACVWLIAGTFLGCGKCCNPEILVILPLHGEAPAMEADLRELLRSHRNIPNSRIILADCGMTPQSRELAKFFCDRHREVELVAGEQLKIT